jgi:hypothetical protein
MSGKVVGLRLWLRIAVHRMTRHIGIVVAALHERAAQEVFRDA